jgi:hypothetical protein
MNDSPPGDMQRGNIVTSSGESKTGSIACPSARPPGRSPPESLVDTDRLGTEQAPVHHAHSTVFAR